MYVYVLSYGVGCKGCYATGPDHQSREQARGAWNTRADSYTPSDPKADYEAER